jgi:hypothetical protein
MIKLFDDEHIDRRGSLLAGRKMLIGALALYLLLVLLTRLFHLSWFLSGPLAIATFVMSALAANKIGLGLYDSPLTRVAYVVAMIVPFIGLAAIVVLLLRAQRGLQTTA